MAPFGFPEAAFILEFGADVVYCILGHDTFDTFSELLAYWTHIEQKFKNISTMFRHGQQEGEIKKEHAQKP